RVEHGQRHAADRFVVVPTHTRMDEHLGSLARLALMLVVDLDHDTHVAAGMTRQGIFGVGDDLAAPKDAKEDLGLGVIKEFIEVAGVEVHVELAAPVREHAADECSCLTVRMTSFDLHLGEAVPSASMDDLTGYV